MRVVVGVDGSAASDRAVQLVAGIDWPAQSRLRLVRAAPPPPEWGVIDSGGQITDRRTVEERQIMLALERAAARFDGRPFDVRAVVRHARPATAILDEALELAADLIVVGNRGRGPFQSALLGSVSAEVVDRADCGVLVARGTDISRLLIADDGSDAARVITDVLCRWQILRGCSVRVVSVAAAGPGRFSGPAITSGERFGVAGGHAVDQGVLNAAWADHCVERLAGCGFRAEADVRMGDPAHEIVKAAADARADLIITGSRGHSRLARLLLGSVARNVVLHAPCSVLVMRRPLQRLAEREIVHQVAGLALE
jgi:nucleotide-binding universal stress UspA family protein